MQSKLMFLTCTTQFHVDLIFFNYYLPNNTNDRMSESVAMLNIIKCQIVEYCVRIWMRPVGYMLNLSCLDIQLVNFDSYQMKLLTVNLN
jgi:hypothetical protein